MNNKNNDEKTLNKNNNNVNNYHTIVASAAMILGVLQSQTSQDALAQSSSEYKEIIML